MRKSSLYALLISGLALSACGKTSAPQSQAKVIGGKQVTDQDPIANATVAFVSQSGDVFCSGTLITPYHVLTAAHCLAAFPDGFPMYVAFGPEIIEGKLKLSQLRTVSKSVIHEKFDRDGLRKELENESEKLDEMKEQITAENDHGTDTSTSTATEAEQEEAFLAAMDSKEPSYDLAVVRLNVPAPASALPVGILSPKAELPRLAKLTLAGYGLRHLDDLFAKEDKSAAEMVSEGKQPSTGLLNSLDVGLLKTLEKAHELLLVSRTQEEAACKGDSGGPVYAQVQPAGLFGGLFGGGTPRLALVGVASTSSCHGLAFYTDARAFRDFINKAIDDLK